MYVNIIISSKKNKQSHIFVVVVLNVLIFVFSKFRVQSRICFHLQWFSFVPKTFLYSFVIFLSLLLKKVNDRIFL